jgi:cell division protein FtsB
MARNRPTLGVVIYFALAFVLGLYFTFASVQGDYGLFRRVQIAAEAEGLREELARLEVERAALENRTRRMSDAYLDLDLLDQQARDVLGLVRIDEVVLR